MNVRPMRRSDLEAVVAIHLAAFPNFFLTFLGPRFLRLFYGAVMRDGIALVATVNSPQSSVLGPQPGISEDRGPRTEDSQDSQDRVSGFVAGMLDSRSFYRRLWRKRFLQVIVAITPVVLRHPSTLRRVARRGVARALEPARGAELMSLAVHPREQRHGAGRALVEAFIDAVRAAGTDSLWLITDAAENDAVKHFYETLGFAVRRTFTNAEGRALVEYGR